MRLILIALTLAALIAAAYAAEATFSISYHTTADPIVTAIDTEVPATDVTCDLLWKGAVSWYPIASRSPTQGPPYQAYFDAPHDEGLHRIVWTWTDPDWGPLALQPYDFRLRDP